MHVTRHYTDPQSQLFADVSFRHVDIEICHADEQSRLCLSDFEVPAHWSYEACEFLARHYLRRCGVPAQRVPVPEEGVPMWLWRSVPNHAALAHLPEAERFGGETSVRQVILRLAGAWTYWGFKHDYFDTEADARTFHDECCHLMMMQAMAPAAPQWLNTGLHWAYGIEGEAQGHFHVDHATGKVAKSGNAYEHPQHHHAFIQSVRDELVSDGGIMQLWEREARLFKYGSGAGCNMSALRAAQEPVADGSPSVGLMRFVALGDKAAGAIRSRAGGPQVDKLVLVDMDHPEVGPFIGWKAQGRHKAAAMACGMRQMRRTAEQIREAIDQVQGEGRFDPQHNTLLRQAMAEARRALLSDVEIARMVEALRCGDDPLSGVGEDASETDALLREVSGTQASLAVRMGDDFMQAVASGEGWPLTARQGGVQVAAHPARELLMQTASAIWAAGDPAVHFKDSIAQWHGCKTSGPINGAGPRGEFLFLDDTACDIATLNLLHFIDADGEFDVAACEHAVRLMVVMLDIAITMGQYPSRSIAAGTYRFRPIGLSYCNLAAALMQMGYAYDSDEGRAVAAAITALMTGAGYVASADLARELGAFEAFSENREPMMQLMWQHHEAALGRSESLARGQVKPVALDHGALPQSSLSDAIHRLWDLAMIRGDEYGYSNAHISVIGSGPNSARLLDAASLAASPMTSLTMIAFAPGEHKQRHIRPQVVAALRQLGYAPAQIDDVVRHVCGAASLKDAPGIDHAALQARGFTMRQIVQVEEALSYVRHIRHAFDPFVIGEGFCRDVLRLNDLQMHDASFDLLAHLGFDAAQIAEAGSYACGSGHMADAPHLREEDLPVFSVAASHLPEDCRVSLHAQIGMMAGIQPFVSGGISHRLEFGAGITAEAIATLVQQAWRVGLKTICLQRSEPVAAETSQWFDRSQSKKLRRMAMRGASTHASVPQPAAVVSSHAQGMPQREELPHRRAGFIQKALVGGEPLYLHSGEYPDGRLGEIFIDLPGQSEMVRALANHFAITVSLALQHGVPLEALRSAFTACEFAPAGVVEGSDHRAHARSLLDYAYAELQAHYGQKHPASMPAIADTQDEVTSEEGADSTAQILSMVRSI